MWWRALAVWCGILVLASVNGGMRQAWLIPQFGETAGRVVSTVILSALVAATTWFTIRWIAPYTRRDAVLIGVMWVALTLGFEFLAGHYLFGNTWNALLADYDLRRGRIWILVVVVVAIAPTWSAQRRLNGLPGRAHPQRTSDDPTP